MRTYIKYICAVLLVLSVSGNAWGATQTQIIFPAGTTSSYSAWDWGKHGAYVGVYPSSEMTKTVCIADGNGYDMKFYYAYDAGSSNGLQLKRNSSAYIETTIASSNGITVEVTYSSTADFDIELTGASKVTASSSNTTATINTNNTNATLKINGTSQVVYIKYIKITRKSTGTITVGCDDCVVGPNVGFSPTSISKTVTPSEAEEGGSFATTISVTGIQMKPENDDDGYVYYDFENASGPWGEYDDDWVFTATAASTTDDWTYISDGELSETVTISYTFMSTPDPGTYSADFYVWYWDESYESVDFRKVAVTLTVAASCTVDPTIGAVSLNGGSAFTLTSLTDAIPVSSGTCSPGDGCEWVDYGFAWKVSGGATTNKVQVGTSGAATSWNGSVQPGVGTTPTAWVVGDTYIVGTYGKNAKTGATIKTGTTTSFVLRSITFNSNGGSSVGPWYVKSGGTYSAPSAPTKTGYTFGGWYQEAELTNAVNWSSAVSENKTYYAKWTAKNYTITLDNQDATTPGTASIGVTYNSNTNLTGTPAITVPTKTGYTFGGYYTSAGGGGSQIIDADGNVNASVASYTSATKQWIYDGSKTLYAKWTGNLHTMTVGAPSDVTITATPAGGSAQAEGATPSVNYGTTVTLNYSSVTGGKYWAGWDVYKTGNAGTKVAVSGSGSGATFTMPDYDVTVNALLFGDLVAFCDAPIITLTTSDGDQAFVTSRFETSKNINIMSTKTLLLSIENVANGESVTISGTDLIFYTDDGTRYSVASLTTPVADQVLYFSYKPSSAGDGSITEPRISVSVAGTTVNFDGKIKARNLPEKVAIVAKAGDTWMALPTPTSETTPEGTVVSVSDGTATGPASVAYKLWPVKTTNPSSTPSDRFGTATSTAPVVQYGDRLRFAAVSNDNKALWANNSTSSSGIKTANAITAIGADGAEPNEWKVETRIVDGQFVYKLQTQQSKNTNYLRYKLGADGGPKWGTYANGDIVDLYILPLTEVTEADIKVMEWGTNKIAVSYPNRASCTAMTAKIGTGSPAAVTINTIGGDLYELTGVGDLQSNPGKSLALAVTEGSAKQKTFLIPYIATSSVAEATIRSAAGGDNAAKMIDVVIRNGGTLTTGTASGAFNDLYIYPGGKADITNNIGFNHVYMRGGYSWLGGDYAHPQLKMTNGKSISGIGNTGCGIFYDIYLDNTMYYMFALPKDVAVTAITNEENGADWDAWIKSYSGEGRTKSTKESGWSYVTSGSIARGAGYEIAIKPRLSRPYGILRFPLLKATSWSDETDPTPEIKGWGANNASVSDNNKGWNCIGNPYLTAYNNTALPGTTPSGKIQTKTLVEEEDASGNWTGKYEWSTDDVKYFTIPRFTEYEYDDVRAFSPAVKLEPFFPFFIQATGDGTISFSGSNKALKMPSFYAEQTAREVFVDFQLQNAEGKTDVAGLTISDQYSENFDMQDKEKTIQNGNATMKVYTMVGEFRTAFNSLPEAVAAMPVPVGYIAPQEGKYNFSLVEGDYSEVEHVWLTDYNEGSTVDMLLGEPYEFETAAGAINNRFAINVILKPENPGSLTDTEVVEDEYAQPQKFIWQDQLYIFNNGRLYDATGKKVREINK